MATQPLVEQVIDRDLPALVALSFEKHGIPVLARFWLHAAPAGGWQIVVVSPRVDEAGTREAYRSAFAALENETFSTKAFLSFHLLLLGERETREALADISRGELKLAALGPFEDVDIYPVAKADEIRKQGFLHAQPAEDEQVLVSFAALDRDGPAKNVSVALDSLDTVLSGFTYSESDRDKLAESISRHRSASMLAQTTLKKLYDAGLI